MNSQKIKKHLTVPCEKQESLQANMPAREDTPPLACSCAYKSTQRLCARRNAPRGVLFPSLLHQMWLYHCRRQEAVTLELQLFAVSLICYQLSSWLAGFYRCTTMVVISLSSCQLFYSTELECLIMIGNGKFIVLKLKPKELLGFSRFRSLQTQPNLCWQAQTAFLLDIFFFLKLHS